MEVVFGGVRGSQPMCGAAFAEFGGDTTSVLVAAQDGAQVVIDAGTGIVNLTRYLDPTAPLLLLLTHYHLDHVCGLPSFAPLYDDATRLTVAGPVLDGGYSAQRVVASLLDRPFWPVPLDELAASLDFVDVTPDDRPRIHGGLSLTALAVTHPGGCVAWRLDEAATGTALVFATDMEWAQMSAQAQDAFATFCRRPAPVDLLVMDGHFTTDNYKTHTGWGHSTGEEVLRLGEAVGARHVLCTHHDPEKDDTTLAADEERLIAAAADTGRIGSVGLARQGQVVTLPPAGP